MKAVVLRRTRQFSVREIAKPDVKAGEVRARTEKTGFCLPVVRRQLQTGRSIRHCAAVIACWAQYAEGTDEDPPRPNI